MGEPRPTWPRSTTLAVAYVSHHPLFFAYVSLRRAVYYWTGFWSFSEEYRQREPVQSTQYVPLGRGVALLMLLRGARRLWRLNHAAALPYLVLIGIFPITYYTSRASLMK